MSLSEWKQYAESAKIIVGRVVLQFLPQFKCLKGIIPDHIPHQYSEQMAQQSTIVTTPIINANEAKYEDRVTTLRTYEKWISEIYVQAGLVQEVPDTDNPPVPAGPAAPGQTNAHTQATPNDPMKDMKVVFAGDQLTRVRFAGGKDLLSGAQTPSDRFEHCSTIQACYVAY